MRTKKAEWQLKGEENEMLYSLVNRLICLSLPGAVKKRSFIINDIRHDKTIPAPKKIITLVLGNLLCDIINYSSNNCIRIGNSPTDNGIIIRMSDKRMAGNKNFVVSMATIQLITERTGENIRFVYGMDPEPRLEICFINRKTAA